MTGSGSNLVIVYHRQPYEEVVENGKTVYRENKSPNGIVPTLKSFFGSVDRGSWVAWKQVSAKKQERFERQVEITDSYGSYTVSRLPLTADQVKKFYHVTSKEALWPILHSFPWLFRYDNADWENFREVNWLFAEAACREAADDALIWIHDYNLWLCPGYIRQMKPDAKIAFFHHTPFPAADVFNILPWREEIVDSLLTCDMIGFHIPRYTQNFVGVARSLRPVTVSREVPVETSSKPLGMALSEPTVAVGLSTGEREIVLDSWPVGTNPAFIDGLLSTDDAKQQVADIGNEITEQKLICSVGRVDYTKGTK
ncbi:MAG: trehalose-6-phosphate synthase, partial [Pseudomonadota bacterium]